MSERRYERKHSGGVVAVVWSVPAAWSALTSDGDRQQSEDGEEDAHHGGGGEGYSGGRWRRCESDSCGCRC